eukprot:gene1083-4314_t
MSRLDGGVEAHIHHIAKNLVKHKVKVVIVTHEYKAHKGVLKEDGITTYYLPLPVVWRENTLPTIIGSFAMLRRLFLFEGVEITVYTDHSLLEMSDYSNRLMAKLLAFTLSLTHHTICVSHTCREHLVCNTLHPANASSVIPNAVDTLHFQPLTHSFPEKHTVVVISRLYWRKGIDLLASVIPIVCSQHQDVDFIIGGDGPMRILLEEMRDQYNLTHRVTMLGSVLHTQVPTVLNRGSVFLNCSRTESFCMAILEAACCGLHVVSTNVGGVPEVLPPWMCDLCDPDPKVIAETLLQALDKPTVAKMEKYSQLRQMYSWEDIALRTRAVYVAVMSLSEDLRMGNVAWMVPLYGIF